ncbi:MAG: sigma 54-interacting transcriptional regulator [Spirochaetales bacterium]|jgi:Nif-specific regulatory protein|nr:sigma 54-interacting transcriptional regulator [Spirochaetales bacterium]
MFKQTIDPKKFETFIEINNLINSNFQDVHALLTKILESAARLVESEASFLLLLEKESQKLYFEIALGLKGPQVKDFYLNPGEGIAGWVAEHRTSLIVNDVDSDRRFRSDISKRIGFPTAAILAAPMTIKKEETVGVIELINKKGGGRFTQEDLDWLEIFAAQAALAIQNLRSFQQAREEIGILQDQVAAEHGYHTFVGLSAAINEKLAIARKVAAADSSVLILGESGVGKELFAEQIHLNSARRDKPFVRVNCAALPETLLESELFGHVKGAFTGAASTRRGRFEIADGGTIFLDEVGDIPLPLQAKLLRVLQHKVFERLGSSEPIRADVRIVAATNKDVEKEVGKGTFRSDLYYRLNVLPLYIPPLRQRTEDIMELADFFLKRFNREVGKKIRGFSEDAIRQMLSYSWPGNVRELENAVERAVVITQEDLIRPEDLLLPMERGEREGSYSGKNFRDAIHGFKKSFLAATLKNHKWNQTAAAKALGIQRTYLTKLVKELEIRK